MRAKNAKTFLLGISALAGVALTSCGKEQSSTQESHVPQKQEQKFDIEKARKEYKQRCADSIRTENGYNDARAQQNQIMDSILENNSKRTTLEFESSLGGTMDVAVDEAGIKILDKYFQELCVLLNKYKISLQSYLDEESTYNEWTFITDPDSYSAGDSKYACTAGVLRYALIYIGVNNNNDEYNYSREEYEKLLRIIENIVDNSEYGQGRKAEIMKSVNTLTEQTKKQLIASRKSIEKQFSDYYVTCDEERLGIYDLGEGDPYYGYGRLNFGSDVLVKYRETCVYDSKLSVDFFGEPGAQYKLVSLGDNKWYVQKKKSSGKIEKTPVFKDAGKTYERQYVESSDAQPENKYYFDYKPGANMGVHIIVEEYTILKKAPKKWVRPQTVVKELNRLEQQNEQMETKRDLLSHQMDSISNRADSIANVMAMKKYPHVR